MLGVGVDVGLLEFDFGIADVVLQHVGIELLEGLQQVVAPKEAHLLLDGLRIGVATEFLHGLLPRGEVGLYLGKAVAEGLLVLGDV